MAHRGSPLLVPARSLTYPDLTPNIGLGWYFFIEMFDHFRAFFVCVFQLHVFAYVAPLTIAFAHEPLFATVLLVGVIAIFKSYPQLGDFTLWHALLACYSELGAREKRPPLFCPAPFHRLAVLTPPPPQMCPTGCSTHA